MFSDTWQLVITTQGAHNALMDLEELEDRELDLLRKKYTELAERARQKVRRGEQDTGIPEVGC